MYFLFRFCYFLSALRFAFSFRPPPSATIIDAVRTVYYYRLSFVIIFLCTSFFRSFCVVLCGRLLVFCHDFISIFNFLSVGTQNKNNKITKTKKKKTRSNQRTFVYTLSSAICCAHGSTLRRISVVNASRRLGTQNVVGRIRKWNNPLYVSGNCRLNIAFLHRRSISECRRRRAIARRSDAKYRIKRTF